MAGKPEQVKNTNMDDHAVRAVLAAYEAAWNSHDMKEWG